MKIAGRRLPRFTRDVKAMRSMEITPRDKEIIRQVGRFHFLRSTQILQLVDGAPAQMVRRLQALYHHGWLDRPRCQIDYFHKGGSRPMVYGLGSRGVAMLRREYDIPFSKMVWGRGGSDVGRVFLDHASMVAEVMISIEKTCEQTTGTVKYISSDALALGSKSRDAFRWTAKVGERHVGLVPDAVFALEFSGASSPEMRVICCLEADRGTMPVMRRSPHLSSIRRKFSAYASLWKAGSFEKRFGSKRLAIITVTTSAERVETITDCVAQLSQGRGLFANFVESEICPDASAFLERCAPWVGGQ